MKKRTSVKEISALCEMLIQDFMTSSHRSSRRLIDIEAFVTRYLGAKLTYETFAEDVPGRGGFFADGKTSLHILRNGIKTGSMTGSAWRSPTLNISGTE